MPPADRKRLPVVLYIKKYDLLLLQQNIGMRASIMRQ